MYRRVVEIRDTRLVLRAYVPPGVAERAQPMCGGVDLPPEDVRAIVEAAVLAAAVQLHTRGSHESKSVVSPPTLAATHLTDEVKFLCRVAWYYRHTPIVRSVVAEVTGQSPTSKPLGLRA